ncbi:MAG: cyclic nucleotide-binding domain-containing protein [Pseudomonadota bacterium]|nr:MAG: cyclic nucleotide-binding domain-containing protein [Pseudomonadota bacterium]
MSKKPHISIEQLKHFEPISSLSAERLEELATLAYIERLGLGVSLFREGDVDSQTVFLLSGDVHLTSSDGKVEQHISSGSKDARFPLDDSQPRQVSAAAVTKVEILRIDNSVLDYMMMWDQLAIAEGADRDKQAQAKAQVPAQAQAHAQVSAPLGAPAATTAAATASQIPEAAQPAAPAVTPDTVPEAGASDWVRKMHHIMAFKNLPPANVKALLEHMEPVTLKAGEVVVGQGEVGDYYYVLTDGSAEVTRTVHLAELTPGASFGEESLVSGSERNASVTMATDGTVMRLSRRDFDALLREPLLNRITPDEARVAVAGGAKWLDVRHAREFNHSRLPGAQNVPLHELRMRLEELDRDSHYICYCRTGHRSSAAAFILAQRGFRASVLTGGVQVMSQDLQA